ncbi:MAG: hypothetical protein EBQ66_10775, partial [Flavobacteriia bacterium]|nr:hypothetical protein [Flavobacteriia bacterium]
MRKGIQRHNHVYFMLKRSRVAAGAVAWCSLGFYRGMALYDHRFNTRRIGANDPPYMYSYRIYNGCNGVFFYANPVFLLFIIPKEIYRLEVNFREIHSEKKKDRY